MISTQDIDHPTSNALISDQTYTPKDNKHMVQYSLWPDCVNKCKFCLTKNRATTNKEYKLNNIRLIRENIRTIDWENQFAYGVSLLGGELYIIKDPELQDAFLQLIDDIIEVVLLPHKTTKFSTVTNGMYNPTFLYKVMDKIVAATGGAQRLDVNFSFDLKYRYHSEKSKELALKNINDFHKRYNYTVGVQMILTQYVIDLWKAGQFDPLTLTEKLFPDNILTFLYPHPTRESKNLPDFNFKRKDFLDFMKFLKVRDPRGYRNFIHSVKNSQSFKYTGIIDKSLETGAGAPPELADGKEVLSPKCGHSLLYQCYADSDRCCLCDLQMLEGEF